ncbi:MAG: carbamate kinase [Anaerolineae bacterium]|nr:carbamate kinase [Anaerolineae bacterium]MCO5189862.1 carbamate kinase [Anaerolineae bacterium]MCO5192834.1 carbamate kinase [Anaerolineae bacterium]MCO5207942.1 carbamate kinase [Anaerolineae bacterium]
MTKTALVAIGGNSLITDKNRPDVPHQWDAVRETCRRLADMIDAGWNLVVTHGNGPQVGFIMRRNELAAHEVHSTPLDIIVADTQGSIGYMLQQALRNELRSRGNELPVASIVTQVLVDEADPAFAKPSKPVGGFMEEEQARLFAEQGWNVVEDAGRGWRRVVASPKPLRVIEERSIRTLIRAGGVVIAAGGGGIPVVKNRKGELREISGVYAVIDKDWASGLLAAQVGIDLFLVSTGVEKVALNFNTPEQQDLDTVTVEQMTQYLNEGHFAPGSMKPKIEAAIKFVTATGNPTVITNPTNLARALAKETGTWIVP